MMFISLDQGMAQKTLHIQVDMVCNKGRKEALQKNEHTMMQ